MFSLICGTIQQEREASAELEKVLTTRSDAIFGDTVNKNRRDDCNAVIKSRYFRITMQVLYELRHWPVDIDLTTIFKRGGGIKLNKILYYYENYDGWRFPKQFVFNFFESFKTDDRYENLFPSKSMLNNIIETMDAVNLLTTAEGELEPKQDLILSHDLIFLIETWARNVHLKCEADLYSILQVYFSDSADKSIKMLRSVSNE
jgi:hypothetical protein